MKSLLLLKVTSEYICTCCVKDGPLTKAIAANKYKVMIIILLKKIKKVISLIFLVTLLLSYLKNILFSSLSRTSVGWY